MKGRGQSRKARQESALARVMVKISEYAERLHLEKDEDEKEILTSKLSKAKATAWFTAKHLGLQDDQQYKKFAAGGAA